MQNQFISKDKIFVQGTNFLDILMKSSGYTDFHSNITNNNLEYNDQKSYEIVSSGFIDFNQHLYEDINEMNSISSAICLEMSLITFRIFVWGSKGEGFEIFKHVLRGEEINNLKTTDDIKEYIYIHLYELEKGIVKTYEEDNIKSFEKFGIALESRKLPLQSILQYISIENNMYDFK